MIRRIVLGVSTFLLLAGMVACGGQQQDNLKQQRKLKLDILRIADKSPQEVIEILGEPDSSYTQYVVTIPVYTQWYGAHQLEIQYLEPEKRARDIVLHSSEGVAFGPEGLEAFGLQAAAPSVNNPNNIRWDQQQGFSIIHFYARQTNPATGQEEFMIFFKK
jgi:hypothetical protein